MNNLDYVQTLGVDETSQHACLQAMAMYGEHHWWEPGTDAKTLAYLQMNEPVLLVNFGVFHAAVEELLGHGVWTHWFLDPKLKEEVNRKYAELKRKEV